MAVRRDHPGHARRGRFHQHAAQVVARFVGADGEDGLVDHRRQHAGGDREVALDRPAGRVARGFACAWLGIAGKLRGSSPIILNLARPHLSSTQSLSSDLNETSSAFGLAHDLEQFARVEREAALLVDAAGNLGADTDLEVGGGQAQAGAVGLEQDVPEYRHRVAPFHDSLHQREAALQHRALDYQFHLSSRRRALLISKDLIRSKDHKIAVGPVNLLMSGPTLRNRCTIAGDQTVHRIQLAIVLPAAPSPSCRYCAYCRGLFHRVVSGGHAAPLVDLEFALDFFDRHAKRRIIRHPPRDQIVRVDHGRMVAPEVLADDRERACR